MHNWPAASAFIFIAKLNETISIAIDEPLQIANKVRVGRGGPSTSRHQPRPPLACHYQSTVIQLMQTLCGCVAMALQPSSTPIAIDIMIIQIHAFSSLVRSRVYMFDELELARAMPAPPSACKTGCRGTAVAPSTPTCTDSNGCDKIMFDVVNVVSAWTACCRA
jgi:hypothetical protein